MTGIEFVFLAIGLAGAAAFTSVSVYFAQRRTARRGQVDVPVPELEVRLQPTNAPLKVRVLTDAGPLEVGTRIVVEGVCQRLTVRRERAPLPPGPAWRAENEPTPTLPARELEIGDAEFDAQFFVLGPPALVHAILDAETRRLLRELSAKMTASELVVEHGQLRVDIMLSYRLHPRVIEDRGREAVEIARRLVKPPDVVRRLAENVQRDPVVAVRLANLNAVLREEPDNPLTQVALRAAATDRDPDVRLRAALALGAEGRAVLLSLIKSDETDDAAVETAIEALGADIPDAVLQRVLRRSIGANLGGTPVNPRAARACVLALGRSRGEDAVSRLQVLLLANASLAEQTARALGDIGGQDAEAALIGALEGDVFESRLAAAKVLGDIGTTAAVPALREAERHGVQIRGIARQAIAEIQARATSAPGAVSLASGEAGQVSMAEDPSGRVSLPARRERP